MKKELVNITILLIILFSTITRVQAQITPEAIKEVFDVRRGGQLTLDSDLGAINVKTSSLNKVEIVVTKEGKKLDRSVLKALNPRETLTAIDVADVLDDFKVTFEEMEGNVKIKGKFKTSKEDWLKKLLSFSLLKIHFEVTIPHRYSVNLNTSNDHIVIDGLIGGVKVQTSIGDLRIGDVKGNIWGRTSSSGNITLKGCQGNVDVETSIGDIDLGPVIGNVKAKTDSSGNITVTGCQGNADLTTSIGDINLCDVTGDVRANGGDIQIGNVGGEVIAQASSSGSVMLTDCRDNVDVKTSIGDVNLRNITGTVRASGGDIQISNVGGEVIAQASSNGSVMLTDCRDNVDVKASIGDINLTNITGSVKSKTGSSGNIQIANVGGVVQAEASIGDLNFSDVKGSVWGRTGSSGGITLNDCQGSVNVMTSIGNIRAEITNQPNRQWAMETSGNGEIFATLIVRIAVNIDAQTNRGNISNDFVVQGSKSQDSIKGTINGGGPLLKLRTSSGDISLRRK